MKSSIALFLYYFSALWVIGDGDYFIIFVCFAVKSSLFS